MMGERIWSRNVQESFLHAWAEAHVKNWCRKFDLKVIPLSPFPGQNGTQVAECGRNQGHVGPCQPNERPGFYQIGMGANGRL